MIFPFRIIRHKPIPKVKRTLNLIHVYTFKDGTNIYTYDDSDLATISGRYIKMLQQNQKFLYEFGITKEIATKWDKANEDLINDWKEGKRKPGDVLMNLAKLYEEKKEFYKYNGSLWEEQWEILFTMFFVLDGEDEMQFSDAENKRKIDLLRGCTEEEREFFFHLLVTRFDFYRDTLKKDIASSIAQMIKQEKEAESWKLLIEQSEARLKLVDTQGNSTPFGWRKSVLTVISRFFQRMLNMLRKKNNDRSNRDDI